jgi:DNA polymerase-1
MGANSLREALGGGVSRAEAAAYLDAYFERFSGLKKYIETLLRDATRNGYVETLFGRRRYLPGLKSVMPQLRSQAERMAVNAPMQGTQADIIKLAMVKADALIEEKGWRNEVKLLMQVHDELVYEIDAVVAEARATTLRTLMESVAPLEKLHHVPILAEASVGNNWGDMMRLKH